MQKLKKILIFFYFLRIYHELMTFFINEFFIVLLYHMFFTNTFGSILTSTVIRVSELFRNTITFNVVILLNFDIKYFDKNY